MDVTKAHIRRQVAASLTKVVEEGAEFLGREEMAGVLEELLADVRGENLRQCHFALRGGKAILTLHYGSVKALERELEILTEVCGMVLEVDPRPPRMQELLIEVRGAGVDSSVELMGRSVQNTSTGVALELFPPDDEQKRELRVLIKKMQLATELRKEPTTAGAVAELGHGFSEASEVRAHDRDDPEMERLIEGPEESARRWRVSPATIPSILMEAAQTEGYALLEFVTADVTRQLVLHHGELIDFRRDPPSASESVAQLLKKTGKVSVEEIEGATRLAAKEAISLGEALVDMGVITHQELLVALRTRLIFLLRQVFSLRGGEALLYLPKSRPARFLRSSTSLVEAVVQHVREEVANLSQQEMLAREKSLTGISLHCSGAFVEMLETGLSEKELRFVELVLKTPRNLEDIYRISNLPQPATLQVLLVLKGLELLTKGELLQRKWADAELDDLEARLKMVNHFDRFGVHWSAFDAEINGAYEEMNKKLEDARLRRADDQRVGELRRKLEESYSVLRDRQRRRSYRDQNVDRFAQESALQIYEKKADSHRMQKDVPGLLECLQRILELQPQNARAQRDYRALKELV